MGSLLLGYRPVEFLWTLLAGPVTYEPTDIWTTGEQVEASITTRDEKRLRELYEHSKGLMEREEDTRNSVEGRANALLATGGLTATLIVGVSGLLVGGNLNRVLAPGSASSAAFAVLYLLGLFALVMSLLRAVQAIGVVAFQPFSATRPFLVQDFAESRRLRKLIREAFLTFVDLREINRLKAGLLASAQWWFGTALVLLLTMAAVPVLANPVGRVSIWLWDTLGICGTVAVVCLIALALILASRIIGRRKGGNP